MQTIQRYIQDAVAAEKSFEDQLQSFAKDTVDDAEVQSVFSTHANETRKQVARLTSRLQELGGSVSDAKSSLAHLFSFTPKLAQAGHVPEERIVQNLIAAFAVAHGSRALYEALAITAALSGDNVTASVAREGEVQQAAMAEKVFHFFSTRSKIAFNVLTAGEIDPAIETKMVDDRIADENPLL